METTPIWKNPRIVAAVVALVLVIVEVVTGVIIPGSI
jgi:hypothetical protein